MFYHSGGFASFVKQCAGVTVTTFLFVEIGHYVLLAKHLKGIDLHTHSGISIVQATTGTSDGLAIR